MFISNIYEVIPDRSFPLAPGQTFSLPIRQKLIPRLAMVAGHFAAARLGVQFFSAFFPLAFFSWQSPSAAFRMCSLFWPFSLLFL
jgi:hypothetical protein